MEFNKFGVPHEKFILLLENGDEVTVDIGNEVCYGNLNPKANIDEYCEKTNEPFFGYRNDIAGYVKVESVIDCDTNLCLDVSRFTEIVESYSSNYGI